MYRLYAVVLLLCSPVVPIRAQSSSATLRGTVTDASGALISGATVTVKPTGNEATFTTSTGRTGEFFMPGLIAGSYTVTVEQLGFNKVYKTATLVAGKTTDVGLVLSVNVLTQSVTVTAQTAAVTEAPTAQTITSVDRQDFKDSPSVTIAESLALIPGVTTIGGNGPRDISISIRGSNDRQTFGIRNAQVFEDGFPVTQPDGLARTDLTDPHAYDSVDVIQGPSSTLYGNFATGGAIFFHTRPGSDVHGVDFGTDVGSFGYLNNYGTIGGAGDNYEYSVFLSNARSRQYTDHSAYNTLTANIFAKYALRKQDRVTLKFINNDLDAALSIRLSLNQYNANPYQAGCANLSGVSCASVSLFSNGFLGTRVSQTADQAGLGRHDRRTIFGARWEHDLTERTTWRTQFVFDNKDINQPTGATSAKGASPAFNVVSDGTRKGPLFGHTSTSYGGGFFKYENLNSYSYNVAPGGNATLGSQTVNYFGSMLGTGFRGREEFALGERTTLVGGFAFEYTRMTALETLYAYSATAAPTTTPVFVNRSFYNIAPEGAVLFRASHSLRLHARLGTGYGTPQASNLFITPQGTYGNNSQLAAQRNVGIDVGADWLLASNIQLTVTGFYERFTNELVSQSAGVNTVGNYTFNAPSSAHRGLVAGVDWHPLPVLASGLRFRSSYLLDAQVYRTYTEALTAGTFTSQFVRDHNSIPGVVPNNLNARVIYDNSSSHFGNFGGYVETNVRDTYWLDNANLLKAPSATLFNLDLHFDPTAGHGLWSRTHVYFDLQNLANRTYVGSASNITDTLSSTTGLQNGVSTLAATTGSVYAGTPRASFGGFRIKF